MYHPHTQTNSLIKRNHRAYLVAVLCGTLLSTAGCGIPGLRRPQCGPAMPETYQWNNGVEFWNTDSAVRTESPVDAPSVLDPQSNDTLRLNNAERADADGSTKQNTTGEAHTARKFIQVASFSHREEAAFELDVASKHDVASEPAEAVESKIRHIETDPTVPDSPLNADQPPAVIRGVVSNEPPTTPSADADFGLIDTDIGPSDLHIQIAPYENSAGLPQAVFYTDPYLLSLISETLTGNQELKILGEEIRIACNEAYARSGEYRPFVTLGAGAGFDKPGRHTRAGAVEHQLEVAPGTEFPEPLGDFGVGANVSWELDIWHKLRNSQRAAAMRYLGTREGRNYIVTRVVAEVAENYYRLLASDSRLQVLQATIDIQQQSLQVAEAKKNAGRGTELAVQRFEAEVQKNLSERSLIAQQIVEIENRINFLAGRYPQPVERLQSEFVDLHLNALGAGVPSEILQNRADIREAERQVAAAGLDVKVARARFYPSLDITAGLGWNAFSTGYLFRTPESLVYGLAGELVGPLINKRAIKADYCSANAAQLQAIYNYQQTVLEAHIEVVNQITKVENYRRSIEVKKRQLDALQASVDSANQLFQNARAEYVEVLLAQRELQEARVELIETKQEQLSAIVNAYQALGGGGF